MPTRQVVTLAARTATFNSANLGAVDSGSGNLVLLVNVTVISGTPTMDIDVEWSPDGGTTFYAADPADDFTQITAVGTAIKAFVLKAKVYRIVFTIGGGSPSLTFEVHEFIA